MEPKPFRVIDTGLRGGRENIAFDQALIEAHKAGIAPDTLRFLHFRPCALVGRHQYVDQEIKKEWCREHDVEIVRRITGGGAIYFDQGQMGWELVFHRRTLGIADLSTLARRLCEAAALGLARLGVAARYRPRNDIEVDGRKISGSGGFFDGDTLFYQGTLLIDFDPGRMIAALNVPAEKLARHALDDARDRVITLKQLMGSALPDKAAIQEALLAGFAEGLGIDPVWGGATATEEALAEERLVGEIGTDSFVYELDRVPEGADFATAQHTGPGGTLKVTLRLEGPDRDRIREALISGDFFATPPRVIHDLEAALRGARTAEAGERVRRFFEDARIGLLSVAPADFQAVIEQALAR